MVVLECECELIKPMSVCKGLLQLSATELCFIDLSRDPAEDMHQQQSTGAAAPKSADGYYYDNNSEESNTDGGGGVNSVVVDDPSKFRGLTKRWPLNRITKVFIIYLFSYLVFYLFTYAQHSTAPYCTLLWPS